MRKLLARSFGVSIRALKSFGYFCNRLVLLAVVIVLLSLIFSSLCVAIPYYLKGTKYPSLYYLLYPLLAFPLLHVLFNYYRRDLPREGDYCQSCDDCVIGLYGHASFLGVCIGLHNGRHFLAFLAYSIIYSAIAAAVTVPLAVQLLWEPSLLYRICYESHLGLLSTIFCYSWDSSQRFMLFYLLSAGSALSISLSLVPVLILYVRFITNGWSFSAEESHSWISRFDRNFVQKFLRLTGDRANWSTVISTIVIPTRFTPYSHEFYR